MFILQMNIDLLGEIPLVQSVRELILVAAVLQGSTKVFYFQI